MKNRKESRTYLEVEPRNSVVDIFRLSEQVELLAQVQEKIRRQNGSITVMVHPFFEGDDLANAQDWIDLIALAPLKHGSISSDFVEKILQFPVLYNENSREMNRQFLARYVMDLADFIKKDSGTCILIAEEASRMQQTNSILRAVGFTGTILVYPTKKSAPEPQVKTATSTTESILEKLLCVLDPNYRKDRTTPALIRKKRWNALVQTLQLLDIKKMVVGGQYSKIIRKRAEDERTLQTFEYDTAQLQRVIDTHEGCVAGFMINVLKAYQRTYATQATTEESIKVVFSMLNYPDGYLEFEPLMIE